MICINGKYYPMWSQFIETKDQFIGGVLNDMGDGYDPPAQTEIVDITLCPNGDDSAFFSVVGKDFTCGFDCKHGGIIAGDEGWITFSGYGDHTWCICNPVNRDDS